MSVEIMTDDNYKDLIDGASTLIVDVWADWCGPCRRTTPVFEEMAENNQGSDVVFAKMDADSNQKAAGEFKITSLPSFLIFENSKVKKKWAGADVGRLRKEIKNLVED